MQVVDIAKHEEIRAKNVFTAYLKILPYMLNMNTDFSRILGSIKPHA